MKVGRTRVERTFVPGPAGRLEAVLEWYPELAPALAVLVCHPHPLYGGSLHNKVVYRAAKAALQLGLPALRLNFRGVGKSQGQFAQGVGERHDVHAALDYLEARFPHVPICLIGFSFGACVGLEVGVGNPRVLALVGLGVPTASEDLGFLLGVTKPKLIIQGTDDPCGPRSQVESLFESLAEPKQL